jgi:putative hydrolase of the HAD superfamily
MILAKTYRYAFFDLDNTLYPRSCGLMEAIGDRINLFMVERLGVRPEEVRTVRDDFLRAFGTTLNALRHFYDVDPDEFLSFVHDLPITQYLQHEQALDQMLEQLPLTKVVFTNADALHARRVLSRLGVIRHFESIIDIHMLDFVNKPYRRAYFKAMDIVSARPEECFLLEDSPANILSAAKVGMTTVMVGERSATDGAHYHIHRITDFEKLYASL